MNSPVCLKDIEGGFWMIRQATIEDAQSVLPIINIVFEEMEMPLFQEIPL